MAALLIASPRRFLALAVLLAQAAGCRGGGRAQDAPDAAASALPTSIPSADAAPARSSAAAPPPSSAPRQPQRSERSRCALVKPGPTPSITEAFATARKLRSAGERDELMLLGQQGQPKRIAVRVQGTFNAGCECPPFTAWFTAPREGEEGASNLLVVERPGAIGASIGRMWLEFILVGYFSGATIDTYEWFRARGVAAGTPGEEERHTWLDLHPELCLEAWCYVAPTPTKVTDPIDAERARFLDGVSAADAAELARRGVPRCDPRWVK